MNFAIRYLTEYPYTGRVTDNLNALRVRPATTSTQRVDDFHVRVDPEARLQRHLDYYGTEVIEFGVAQPHDHLSIDVRARVVTAEPGEPPDEVWEALEAGSYEAAGGEFLLSDDAEPENGALDELFEASRATSPLATLRLLCELVPDRFEYRQGATYVGSTIQDLLDAGAGVCQDFVHLGLVLLRRHGIAARYVSGYLWAAPQRRRLGLGRGRDPRLAGGAAARRRPARRAGVGRRRPDQPPDGGRDPRQDRPRPRLLRRAADQGGLPRPRGRRARRGGDDDPPGSAGQRARLSAAARV